MPEVRLKRNDIGLCRIADSATEREEGRGDERFGVVLDWTSFGHCISEVELVGRIEESDEQWVMGQRSGKPAGRLDLEVVGFMRRYCWAFP